MLAAIPIVVALAISIVVEIVRAIIFAIARRVLRGEQLDIGPALARATARRRRP